MCACMLKEHFVYGCSRNHILKHVYEFQGMVGELNEISNEECSGSFLNEANV